MSTVGMTATERLYTLSQKRRNEELDIEDIRRLVRDGADVSWKQSPTDCPTLLRFALRYRTSALLACLTTNNNIDFAFACGFNGETLLHLICRDTFPPDEALAVLKAVLEHLRTHPDDRIDWAVRDWNEREFISLSAETQMLSRFYPLLRDMPYFAQRRQKNTPIPLHLLYSWDWEALEESDKCCFDTSKAEVIEANRFTGELWWCSHQWRQAADVCEVSRLVESGAEVNWRPNNETYPTLVGFALRRHTPALLECLKSPKNIDFSLSRYDEGDTVLHSICCVSSFSVADGTAILRAIVTHVERHPEDTIDWGQEDMCGTDFIHEAAANGMLSAFYPIVRRVPYFDDRVEPIHLESVETADWAALSEEDRKNFIVDTIVEGEGGEEDEALMEY